MRRVEWVLFDLGGVLVDVEQVRIFNMLASYSGLKSDFVAQRLLDVLPLNSDFITREYLPIEVTADVNQALGTNLHQDDVIKAVNAELGATIQTTADLLPRLRFRTKIGCLSNTNSIHWEELLRNYAFMNDFDRRFASQLVGHAKPGKEIFLTVADMLDVNPKDILFFDDKQENVSMAQKLGWNARVYQGPSVLMTDLKEFGLL